MAVIRIPLFTYHCNATNKDYTDASPDLSDVMSAFILNDKWYLFFTLDGTITFHSDLKKKYIEMYAIGGGGGGAGSSDYLGNNLKSRGGGGGSGGEIACTILDWDYNKILDSEILLEKNAQYQITIGQGGHGGKSIGHYTKGNNSKDIYPSNTHTENHKDLAVGGVYGATAGTATSFKKASASTNIIIANGGVPGGDTSSGGTPGGILTSQGGNGGSAYNASVDNRNGTSKNVINEYQLKYPFFDASLSATLDGITFGGGGGGGSYARSLYDDDRGGGQTATANGVGVDGGGNGGGGNLGQGHPSNLVRNPAQDGTNGTGGGGGGGAYGAYRAYQQFGGLADKSQYLDSEGKGGNGGSGILIIRGTDSGFLPIYYNSNQISTLQYGIEDIRHLKYGNNTIY